MSCYTSSSWGTNLLIAFLLCSCFVAESSGEERRHVVRAGSEEAGGSTTHQKLIGDGPSQKDATRVVRAAYDRLAHFIEKSGKKVSFVVSELETVGKKSFDEIYYADVVTFPTGWVIDVTPSRHEERESLSGGGTRVRRTTEFLADWSHRDVAWDQTSTGRRMLALKLDEVIQRVGQHDKEAAATVAMTRYKVTVRLGDRTRTYRAAFFWIRDDDSGDWRARPLDLITQGLAQAAVETEVKGEWEWLDEPPPARRSQEDISSISGRSTFCNPNEDVESESKMSALGTNDHFTGNHHSEATFKITCACQSSCNNTCSAAVVDVFCEDTNNSVMGFCHAFGQAQQATSDSQGDGQSNAPSCAAGFGCVQKTCELCFCGVSVSVGISSTNVSFSESGSPDWSGNLKKSKTCPVCTEFEEPVAPAGSDPDPIPCDCCNIELCTPIVVDLTGDGFQLTALEEGVQFDLGADGTLEQVAWTDPSRDDVFLALDRNGNGWIDDGAELFGAATDQPESDIPHGYRALAIFDKASRGGNEDGLISTEDAVFNKLLVWRDANQNGMSEAEEITPLERTGIESISLELVESARRDRNGNLLRWASRVRIGGVETLRAVDVIFVTDDSPE